MFEFVLATSGFVVCMFLVAKYGPHLHSFRLPNYLLILALPTLAVLILAVLVDIRVVWVYVASALLGTAGEYSFGRMYHVMMGVRLWKYWKYSIGGYTSWLVMPLWGCAGVLFYVLGQAVALG